MLVQLAVRGICELHANLCNTMDILVKTVVKYTLALECACYAVRGSVYDETSLIDKGYGTLLIAPCKLNSWVTLEFVGNTSIFSSSELTKHFKHPSF